MSRERGQQFETFAADYLRQQGLQLLASNVSCRFGELDLICKDRDCLVFVEVKYRKTSAYGSAAAMVTTAKQQKLRLSASWYLQQKKWRGAARFDVLAIEGDTPYQFSWLKNAF
ncbi:MAG: YraN family protein [Rheinheimera sp.]|nr:MAG: YraN family protein [Rheinheimera sp.]